MKDVFSNKNTLFFKCMLREKLFILENVNECQILKYMLHNSMNTLSKRDFCWFEQKEKKIKFQKKNKRFGSSSDKR